MILSTQIKGSLKFDAQNFLNSEIQLEVLRNNEWRPLVRLNVIELARLLNKKVTLKRSMK